MSEYDAHTKRPRGLHVASRFGFRMCRLVHLAHLTLYHLQNQPSLPENKTDRYWTQPAKVGARSSSLHQPVEPSRLIVLVPSPAKPWDSLHKTLHASTGRTATPRARARRAHGESGLRAAESYLQLPCENVEALTLLSTQSRVPGTAGFSGTHRPGSPHRGAAVRVPQWALQPEGPPDQLCG